VDSLLLLLVILFIILFGVSFTLILCLHFFPSIIIIAGSGGLFIFIFISSLFFLLLLPFLFFSFHSSISFVVMHTSISSVSTNFSIFKNLIASCICFNAYFIYSKIFSAQRKFIPSLVITIELNNFNSFNIFNSSLYISSYNCS